MQYITRRPESPINRQLKKEDEFYSEGRKPPVLVVLHGYGTDENDLLPIAEQIGASLTKSSRN